VRRRHDIGIDWTIDDCRPVKLDEVVTTSAELAAAVLGARPDGVTVERRENLVAEERAADSRSFWANVGGSIAGQPFKISLAMFPDMDASQRYVRTENIASGHVGSDRTDASVSVGLLTAFAWLKLAGGYLYGSGLRGRAYTQVDLAELIESYEYAHALPADRLALIREQVWRG
jgi:hypothetical protein